MQRTIIQFIGILAGSFIFTFGLNNFIIANHLAEGGFVGISLLGLYLYNIPLGLTFLVLNIPLFLFAWKRFGRMFILKTIVGVVAVSVFSAVTNGLFSMGVHDKLLAALYGGVVSGFGLGIIFRFGGTTGGADIIARVVNKYFGWSMGRTMFMIDVVVITTTAFIVGKDAAMYSLVALFVSARVIDTVIEGVSSSRAMFIISDYSQQIASKIQDELERGTTLLKGTGGYTGRDKEVLYVVVSREEISRINEICRDIDPLSFIVVNDVHDVLGEGFNPLTRGNPLPVPTLEPEKGKN
ncbi:MAG: YitT family protein [Tumebacillaceae bacterium]